MTARCRCNGTGRIRDLAALKLQGVAVDKNCDRCSGQGFRCMPATRAFRAVKLLVHERTWNRNWKPFFEKLVTKCEIEENHADAQFRKVRR
ncbi:antitermination protein [Erwinia sp. P6884]|uniref:antitermination protein Q n=1 Tax=Erwinia sp. P6884 TaxID=3141450 RepID=UPI00318ECE9C